MSKKIVLYSTSLFTEFLSVASVWKIIPDFRPDFSGFLAWLLLTNDWRASDRMF